MVEIRIYVEGGGDENHSKRLLRRGFNAFLKPLVDVAREHKISWSVMPCGSRRKALKSFENALEDYPDAFNILLVDSECAVTDSNPWTHLKKRDAWKNPGARKENCHLMVQTMEAWIIADLETLKRFYGRSFKSCKILETTNVEKIGKDALRKALIEATEKSPKGKYHKIHHASKLLALVDVDLVRSKAPHCDRLLKVLESYIKSA